MPMPAEPILTAAVRWLERLPHSSVARCRALFTNHQDFGDLTPTQYEAAYAWLRTTGLLEDLGSPTPPAQRVFTASFGASDTPWLRDADLLIRTPDDLPDDALRAAEALGISRAQAFGQVTTLWGKVDAAERARIGAAGELSLVRLLEDNIHAEVEHVAACWDGLGYDISVSSPEIDAKLEVKSTRRHARLVFYLSRNEYETMLREPAWQLVMVRLNAAMELAWVGTIPADWIRAQAALDHGRFGKWESCRFDVPTELPKPGLPFLGPAFKVNAPSVLRGSVGQTVIR